MAALPDHVGDIDFVYAPHPDGHADPREVVWTCSVFDEVVAAVRAARG